MGRRVLSLPDNLSYQEEMEDSDFQINANDLSRRVKHLNSTMNQFWKRWRYEYLIELRETHRHATNTTSRTQVAVGDLVMVHNENQQRRFWKLAKVQSLIIRRDGKIRGATLRVSSRSGKSTVLQHPTTLLYPLEVNSHDMANGVSINEEENEVRQDEETQERLDSETPAEKVRDMSASERPRREAAGKAKGRVRTWATMLNNELD